MRVLLALVAMALAPHAAVSAKWQRPEVAPIGERQLRLARSLETSYDRLGSPAGERVFAPPDVDSFERNTVPGEVIVGFVPGQEQEARHRIEAQRGLVKALSRSGANFMVVRLPSTDLRAARDFMQRVPGPSVTYVEPQGIVRACFMPNDSFFSTRQWGHWVMYSDLAWDLSQGSRSVKVAIVDQGIDYYHRDLAGCFESGLKGYDFVDDDPDPYPLTSEESHGTHVAGIVAAGINNLFGVAGWANVTLYSCRALNDSGSGLYSDIADAIRWAADRGVRVISMSFGGAVSSATLSDAADYAWSRGALLVGASGNDGVRGVYYPAAIPSVVAVGALDTSGVRVGFSNYGPELELIAPGVDIYSTMHGGWYASMSGTSMACPFVSGAAALLFSYQPGLTNSRARAILDVSAIDMYTPGHDIYYGYGLVNAFRAMQLAAGYPTDSGPAEKRPEADAASRRRLAGRLPAMMRSGQTLPAISDVALEVTDVQGRRVRSYSRGHQATLDLKPGIYWYRLKGEPGRNSSARSAKLIVVE